MVDIPPFFSFSFTSNLYYFVTDYFVFLNCPNLFWEQGVIEDNGLAIL